MFYVNFFPRLQRAPKTFLASTLQWSMCYKRRFLLNDSDTIHSYTSFFGGLKVMCWSTALPSLSHLKPPNEMLTVAPPGKFLRDFNFFPFSCCLFFVSVLKFVPSLLPRFRSDNLKTSLQLTLHHWDYKCKDSKVFFFAFSIYCVRLMPRSTALGLITPRPLSPGVFSGTPHYSENQQLSLLPLPEATRTERQEERPTPNKYKQPEEPETNQPPIWRQDYHP